MIRSFPPHPNPLPCLRRSGFAQAGPRGEGRPFIPPAELGGILAYFDKLRGKQRGQPLTRETLKKKTDNLPNTYKASGVNSEKKSRTKK